MTDDTSSPPSLSLPVTCQGTVWPSQGLCKVPPCQHGSFPGHPLRPAAVTKMQTAQSCSFWPPNCSPPQFADTAPRQPILNVRFWNWSLQLVAMRFLLLGRWESPVLVFGAVSCEASTCVKGIGSRWKGVYQLVYDLYNFPRTRSRN
jgi:hypothetical protein